MHDQFFRRLRQVERERDELALAAIPDVEEDAAAEINRLVAEIRRRQAKRGLDGRNATKKRGR